MTSKELAPRETPAPQPQKEPAPRKAYLRTDTDIRWSVFKELLLNYPENPDDPTDLIQVNAVRLAKNSKGEISASLKPFPEWRMDYFLGMLPENASAAYQERVADEIGFRQRSRAGLIGALIRNGTITTGIIGTDGIITLPEELSDSLPEFVNGYRLSDRSKTLTEARFKIYSAAIAASEPHGTGLTGPAEPDVHPVQPIPKSLPKTGTLFTAEPSGT